MEMIRPPAQKAAKLVWINVLSSILYRPIATVQSFEIPELSISLANTKSLHGARNAEMIWYTMIGLHNGIITWKKICSSLAPSILAASRIETGMVSIKPLTIR